MNRLDKLVIALLFVVLAVMVVGRRAPLDDPMGGRRPIPPSAEIAPAPPVPEPLPPRARRPLPVPSSADPTFVIESPDELPKRSTGTAFSINSSGVWMTARHVTHECAFVGLMPWGGQITRATVAYAHPTADVSIIATSRGVQSVTFADGAPVEGQSGFGLGFPRGEPGATHLSLIGRSRTKAGGRMASASPTLSWAEVERFPDSLDTLAG